ncbi:MAG: hypothetical protein NVS2B7_22770 [Herpetosiphon sp.]
MRQYYSRYLQKTETPDAHPTASHQKIAPRALSPSCTVWSKLPLICSFDTHDTDAIHAAERYPEFDTHGNDAIRRAESDQWDAPLL